ncbi:hypothetical protein M3484_22470 [Pseudomonas sp. GX19020]|uniref:hypothetical protein n=1 Tax=Pseudomonas sp. GX19020 TaxID=2942277 RepID=UPI002018689A|nr:hypothetical protein [Pseudomonas sp. GX19020]MCL4069327.1 hypothetical protein [Pseudomonas sp. GX19020]
MIITHLNISASASQALDLSTTVPISAAAIPRPDGGLNISGFIGEQRGHYYQISLTPEDMLRLMETVVTNYVAARLPPE